MSILTDISKTTAVNLEQKTAFFIMTTTVWLTAVHEFGYGH